MHVRKGRRGGEYGGMIIITSNSRACKEGKEREGEGIEEFEGGGGEC